MTGWQNKLTLGGRKAKKDASDSPAPADSESTDRAQTEDTPADSALADSAPADIDAAGDTAEASNAPFRVHDYRPDVRRSTLAGLSSDSRDEPWTPPTETLAPAAKTEALPERFLTRRELRMRERAEAAGESSPDAATAGAAGAQPAAVEPVADEAGVVEELAVDDTEVVEPEIVDADADADAHVVEAELVAEPEAGSEPGPEPGPEYEAPEAARGIEPAPGGTGVVFGHWSNGGTLDELDRGSDAVLSRDVGVATGAITTHALVLPSIPESSDQLLNSLTSAGNVLVTGSVDLPRTFGSTGAHPALFDHPDVDALIDEDDWDDAAAESAPVRATRAVSSTSSNRSVIEPPPRRKVRPALVAGITAGAVLLLGAGGVAAGLIFNLF